jgi:Myc proto-oncogene protein
MYLTDFSSLSIFTEDDIDVVNVSEKNLPTNPSARDRRALQNTVANKIARSKHSNQRRRVSDDESLSSSTSTLSSKGSTPMKVGSQTPQRSIFTSRKRKDINNNIHDSLKKYRHGKRQRFSHSKHMKIQQQQQIVDPDEAETIEKRNLHNNMERQRRIGLKNLFEELKCQIPSLKDKERAPKVNILREAAVYCRKLRHDEDLHAELTRKHSRLVTRVRNLKASIASQQRKHY